jgi:hypothetical protein
MKAGAPIGNNNAEEWSLGLSTDLFNKALELTNEEDDYIFGTGLNVKKIKGFKFDFIGELARELNTYHQIFGHLKKRFPELESIYSHIINNLESNCYSNTKKGIIKEATGIVNLKSNHNWTDRQHIDQETKADITIKLESEEQKKELDEF